MGTQLRSFRPYIRPASLAVLTLCLAAAAYWPARYLKSIGDVELYHRYAHQLLEVPHAWPKEYPPAAALIFIVPEFFSHEHYAQIFQALSAIALAVVIVTVDRVSRGGWALFALFALGAAGTVFSRYDIFVTASTVAAFAFAARRQWVVAQACLTVGVAIKLFPLMLLPLVVLAQMRSERRLFVSSLAAGAGFCAAVGAISWFVASDAVVQMFAYHHQRPFEIGSIGATLTWLSQATAVEFSYVSYNIQSTPDWLRRLSPALGVAAPLAVYWAFWKGWLTPAGAWALVLLSGLIASKVFSPQYLIWILPFVVLADRAARDAFVSEDCSLAIWAGIAALTTIEYPIALENLFPIMESSSNKNAVLLIVALRNCLLLIALVVGLMRWRSSARPAVVPTV